MKFVKQIAGATALGTAALLGASLFASPAQAAFITTLQQAGNNVVATGSGAIDLTGLTLEFSGVYNPSFIQSNGAAIVTGSAASPPPPSDIYQGITTYPLNFGSGGNVLANSGSGGTVGPISAVALTVPHNYASGASLSSGAIWDNQSFASLGVTPGIYTWSWGNGPDQSFTLDAVTPNSVPEPSALVLLGTALAGIFLFGPWAKRRDCHAQADLADGGAPA